MIAKTGKRAICVLICLYYTSSPDRVWNPVRAKTDDGHL